MKMSDTSEVSTDARYARSYLYNATRSRERYKFLTRRFNIRIDNSTNDVSFFTTLETANWSRLCRHSRCVNHLERLVQLAAS